MHIELMLRHDIQPLYLECLEYAFDQGMLMVYEDSDDPEMRTVTHYPIENISYVKTEVYANEEVVFKWEGAGGSA